jgi:hypothetical protein
MQYCSGVRLAYNLTGTFLQKSHCWKVAHELCVTSVSVRLSHVAHLLAAESGDRTMSVDDAQRVGRWNDASSRTIKLLIQLPELRYMLPVEHEWCEPTESVTISGSFTRCVGCMSCQDPESIVVTRRRNNGVQCGVWIHVHGLSPSV